MERILFDHIGTQLQQNGTALVVRARKEVIAAAGACNPQQYLTVRYRRHEIVASFWHHINNLYVGENLQDHMVCSIGFEAKDHLNTLDHLARQDPKVIEAAMGE